MSAIRWTSPARRDLSAIHGYISQDSERIADMVIARLVAIAERAADFPASGRMVPEFADPVLREAISRPYRIVYEVVGAQEINVLRVLHGARLFPESL